MIEHTPYGVYIHCVPIKKDVKSLIVFSFKKLTSWPRRNLRTDLWENKWLLPKSFNSISSFEKKLKDCYWYMYGQSCPTLCQPMDCMQSTSILFPRIFQARIMDTVWGAISYFQIQESNPDLLHLLHHHADSLPGRHLGIPKTSIHGWEFELIPWRRLWITQLFIILNKILSLIFFIERQVSCHVNFDSTQHFDCVSHPHLSPSHTPMGLQVHSPFPLPRHTHSNM